MTSLTDDLRGIVSQHVHRADDALVTVPIGALRAALISQERFDRFPLVDRTARPEWLARLALDKLPGGKNENLALARREMGRG